MNTSIVTSEILSGATVLSATERIAVVDIGSNSVRLVVYDRNSRVLLPLFNEKIFCGIGQNLASTRRLYADGVQQAIHALERFKHLIENMRAHQVEAVATAAVRDAQDGRSFVAHAENVLGWPIRIISGEEEARYSALGVLAGIPYANGIVGDLGGGSLELVQVGAGSVGEAVTVPLGPLRLMDKPYGTVKAARVHVAETLKRIPWLKKSRGQPLYLVGGSWRNLARVHLAHKRYPLTILHEYAIDGTEALAFCTGIAAQGKKSLEFANIPKKRAEGLPYAAMVLEEIIALLDAPQVVISAYGLREGIIAEIQGPEMMSVDPVLAAARDLCGLLGRDPALASELVEWTEPLFKWETQAERRLRVAACWLSDIASRNHPEYRSDFVYTRVLSEQFAGLDHPGRMFLALTLHERYQDGEQSDAMIEAVRRLMTTEQRSRARILGRALRLGVAIGAGSAGTLPQCPLAIENGKPRVKLPERLRPLSGEVVDKRLKTLAEAMRRDAEGDLI